MTTQRNPIDSLRLGQWFKLICGASYQDVSRIQNLALVYSLAGADCIDVAADPAVVHAALGGIAISQSICPSRLGKRPWLMVSFNDGQDPHFRKAWFDSQRCPIDCSRPCERICPASAIPPRVPETKGSGAKEPGARGLEASPDRHLGVIAERCYGCGRCLPACPHNLIEEHSFTVAVKAIAPTLFPHIDAIEIHTQIGRQAEFQRLWRQLTPYISQLKLVSVSCPDSEPHSSAVVDYLTQLYQLMVPKPNQLLWQTDGRPMSGDLGRGTTHATICLAQKVLNACLPGYVQLAGGTNDYTVAKLRSQNLLQTEHLSIPGSSRHEQRSISGVAYGSYARRLVNLEIDRIEEQPEQLWQQVSLARALVGQIKPNIHHSWHDAAIPESDNPPNCFERTSAAIVPP
ncbi:MAG: LdpA C-terminal domain-containing domain [Cyanobacteria bacterium P01_H01_bin.26]